MRDFCKTRKDFHMKKTAKCINYHQAHENNNGSWV